MIRIYDLRFKLLGEIDTFQSLIFTHKFNSAGDFELHVHFDTKYAEHLTEGAIICVNERPDCVGVIRSKRIKKKDNVWVIRGYTLNGIVSKRITYPIAGRDTQRVSGNYETVMKEIVRVNCINPENPKRKIPGLVIAQNQQRGTFGTWETRYKKLHEELEELSIASNIGWDIHFDLINLQLVFDVYAGVDRSSSQTDRQPVIFSTDFQNVIDLEYVVDATNSKNLAIVAGQGEGSSRMVVEVGAAAEFEREEIFIDARDVEAATDLPERGAQKLSEFKRIETFDGEVVAEKYVFKKDYHLGDIVTIQDVDWKVTMETKVTEVREVWEGVHYRAEPVFGNNIPTVWDAISKEMRQIRNGIRK